MTQSRDPFAGAESYVDRIRHQAEEQKRRDRRPRAMTYRIGDELVQRINATAERQNVEKSALVRALLGHALDALEAGEWVLPIRGRQKLDV
jgi:hypothetical protein